MPAGPPGGPGLAVVLVALGGLALPALDRRYRPAITLTREDPAAARGAGIPVERLRVGALVVSAVLGGAAGSLLVQLGGVADPPPYGPLLSGNLFIVVVLGPGRVGGAAS